MADRFYAPDLNPEQTEYLLSGPEAHHLISVCRARAGTEITLFNGLGLRAEAIVTNANKREALLTLNKTAQEEPLPVRTIAAAIPKGDRALVMIEKCTELGITRFVPLQTERSVTLPREGKRDRFERTVIEACKQSGRDFLMTIEPAQSWNDFVTLPADEERWMFDVSGDVLANSRELSPSIIAIGPEGGWTAQEVDNARQTGWKIVRIPGAILRVETAAIAAASLMQYLSR